MIYLVLGLCSRGSSMVVQARLAFLVQVLRLWTSQALPPWDHLVPPLWSSSVSWQHLLQHTIALLLLDVVAHCTTLIAWFWKALKLLGFAGVWHNKLFSQPGDCWLKMFVGMFGASLLVGIFPRGPPGSTSRVALFDRPPQPQPPASTATPCPGGV